MKVLLICLFAIVGALGVPHHHVSENHLYEKDNYDFTNHIDEDVNAIGDKYPMIQQPGLSLPLYVYKQVLSMNGGDMRSVADVIKALVKPIITSIEFQVLADFVDESLRLFKEDPQIKALVRNGVDSIQNMYETADGDMAKSLLTWMVTQYSDEETARSLSNMMMDTIETWVLEPIWKTYRSYINPTLGSLRTMVDSFFGDDIVSNEIARSGSWSDIVDVYIAQLSDMTSDAVKIIRDTASFLQHQESGLKA